MKDYSNYMGGTNISLEALKEIEPTAYVSGGHIPIENWLEEVAMFDSLEIGKSKVYIPYGGVEKHGILKSIDWRQEKVCSDAEEHEDWWYFQPILIVDLDGVEWFVYEMEIYDENKEVVHINRITPQTVEVFTPANRSMGFVNEYEFNDLRVQIAEHKLEGYYVMYNNIKHPIDQNGRIENWSQGLFDLFEIQLSKIFSASRPLKTF